MSSPLLAERESVQTTRYSCPLVATAGVVCAGDAGVTSVAPALDTVPSARSPIPRRSNVGPRGKAQGETGTGRPMAMVCQATNAPADVVATTGAVSSSWVV